MEKLALTMDHISLILSCTSLLLAIIAIAQALYFFCQTKYSETKVNESLEAIKTQAKVLEKLTDKQLNKLTHFATTTYPKSIENLIEKFGNQPPQEAINLSNQVESLTQEAINAYIATLYYSGLTNIFSRFNLPPSKEEFDPSNNDHMLIQNYVDGSSRDYYLVKSILEKYKSKTDSSSLNHLYKTATAYSVCDTVTFYQGN